MDCGICIEPMLTKNFVPTSSEDDLVDSKDASCIRMRCGHAYHSACIMRCFRSGKGCPSCREDILPEPSYMVFDGDVEFEMQINTDPVVERLDSERMVLRVRNQIIRKAREKLNKSTKSYRFLCETLKRERRTCVKDALLKFRESRKSEYNKVSNAVRKCLADVKKVEFAALRENSSEEDILKYEEWVEIDYDAKELMKSNDLNCPDPLEKSFWRG